MTKRLEDLLDLPESKALVDEAKKEESKKTNYESVSMKKAFAQIAEFDKISSALPAVKELGEVADSELNEIAQKAMTAYDDLMDLGMNVEARYSARIFETAGGMLKTSLDAKVAKMDKKLKMVELQLKKEKMDKEDKPSDNSMVNGEGYVVTDRNSLLEKLKGMPK